MTCPDCGAIGVIPPNPIFVEEEIPEKKSLKVNFRCGVCGEGVTIWAEGTDLYKETQVYTCPFCGGRKIKQDYSRKSQPFYNVCEECGSGWW